MLREMGEWIRIMKKAPLGYPVVNFKPSLQGVSEKNTFTQANAACWRLLFSSSLPLPIRVDSLRHN